MTLPPIDLEFLDEGSTQGSAIAVPAPSPLGLRPEPLYGVSAMRRVSTIAELALQALLGTLFLYVLIFAHGALA